MAALFILIDIGRFNNSYIYMWTPCNFLKYIHWSDLLNRHNTQLSKQANAT